MQNRKNSTKDCDFWIVLDFGMGIKSKFQAKEKLVVKEKGSEVRDAMCRDENI